MKKITAIIFLTFFVSFIETKGQEVNSELNVDKEIPVLLFSASEMLDADGNFNYEDEEKLPWSFPETATFLKSLKTVQYNVTKFGKSNTVEESILSHKVFFSEQEKSINVKLYSDTKNEYLGEKNNLIFLERVGQYVDELNFFPSENLLIYQVKGTETVETVLGTFNCTIVEGVGNHKVKYKYWMINDKPGVFAKIIKVNKGQNTTWVYKLELIN